MKLLSGGSSLEMCILGGMFKALIKYEWLVDET